MGTEKEETNRGTTITGYPEPPPGMTVIVTARSEKVEIGTPGKSGSLTVHFDALDMDQARVILRNAVEILTEARRLTAPPGGDGK